MSLLEGRNVDDLLEMELVKTMILAKEVYSAAFRPLAVETFEWHVLLRLAERDGQSQTELGAKLLRDKVAITRLVAALLEKGLVSSRTDPKDRRKQRIFLTAKARRLVPKLLAERDRVARHTTARFSERDQLELRRILRAWQQSLGELR